MSNIAVINPHAVMGANNPPEPTAIERAEPHIEALRRFLSANPVITTEDEARDGKSVMDEAASALRSIEAERKAKVEPLKAAAKAIDDEHHRFHNPGNKNKPGLWDKLMAMLRSRLTDYAKTEERKRFEAEEAARRAAEEAAEGAKRAAEAEREAREAADAGVCDVDLAGAIEAADTTSQRALRAMWTAQRAEGETKVRIAGGSGNAVSLKDHETLTVTDWKAAIEAIGLVDRITAAILTEARAYRDSMGDLPPGIVASYERRL